MKAFARYFALIASLLAILSSARAALFISEFMANNTATLADVDGDYSDWIEIRNDGTNSVKLLDWALTDDAATPFKWRFPSTNILPSASLIVFASSKDRGTAGAELHTNFKLDADGEYLALVQPDGAAATKFSPTFPPQFPDISFGFSTLVSSGPSQTNPIYFLQPTPGGLNGLGTPEPGPGISFASYSPGSPTTNDDITVTCRVAPVLAPIAEVTLNWRVMFGSSNQTTMLDDGSHGDGLPGDGIFGAIIPRRNYEIGQMVRWVISARDATNRLSRWPLLIPDHETAENLGTMIADPRAPTNLPVWYWFAADPDAGRTRTGTRCSVFFNGEYYDNVFVRDRGGSTATGSQKFDFNTGYHCRINDEIGRVEEANLNSGGSDPSYCRPPLAFESFRLTGHPASAAFPMLMRLNSAPDRLGIFIEQVDDHFLERHGLNPNGALYKFVQRAELTPVFSDSTDGVEKKTRLEENNSDLAGFVSGLNQTNATARETWFFDNMNAASLFDYCALRSVIQDADDVRKNFYLYRDTLCTREWSIFPWDKDWTFGIVGDGGTWLPHPFFGDYAHRKANAEQWNKLYEFLFNDPVTRPLFLRRLRTVMDQQLARRESSPGNDNAESRALARMSTVAQTPGYAAVSNEISGVLGYFQTRRAQLYIDYAATNVAAGADALIPESQSTNVFISIGSIEVDPDSGNQDEEYVQLLNTNRIPIDISGWQLSGAIQHTFLPGSVISASNVFYVSPNVAAFRARRTAPTGGQRLCVQGNYHGHLNASGESLGLLDDSQRLVFSASLPLAPFPQPYLRITELSDPADGRFALLNFTAASNHSYTLQSALSFTAGWTNIGSVPPVSSNRSVWITNVLTAEPARLFRLVIP